MLCTICSKSECCKDTFQDVVISLRFGYILDEYSSLSDAWRVYQGVALYREYRGIGGVTRQLDVVPKPCHICLVKIINMAQSIYQVQDIEFKQDTNKVTAALDQSRVVVSNKAVSGSSQGGEDFVNNDSDYDRRNGASDNDADESEVETKDNVRIRNNSDDLTSQEKEFNEQAFSNKTFVKSSHSAPLKSENSEVIPCRSSSEGPSDKVVDSLKKPDEEDDTEEETVEDPEPAPVSLGRPKRSAGRSLFERNPDFALGREFAKILRQKTMKENSRLKKFRKKLNSEVDPLAIAADSSLSKPLESMDQHCHQDEEGNWRSSHFRSEQLSRLDEVLSSGGWSQTIKNGRNMEIEVFRTATSETDYVSGIQRLIEHFSKGSPPKSSISSSNIFRDSKKTLEPPVKNKRVVKPTRKILDGLDFRRKVLVSKVTCGECGGKFAKTKLKAHKDNVHGSTPEDDVAKEEVPTKNDNEKDNISLAESEMSISSHHSSIRSHQSRSKTRSKSRSSTVTPVPEPHNNLSNQKKSLLEENDMSQKVIDEFADTSSESEFTENSLNPQPDYFLNNFSLGDRNQARKCSLEDNDLEDGGCEETVKVVYGGGGGGPSGRPQRRKRSMEERHPDFVLDLPVKFVKTNPGEEQKQLTTQKTNEI